MVADAAAGRKEEASHAKARRCSGYIRPSGSSRSGRDRRPWRHA
jgi:hypothetical protein